MHRQVRVNLDTHIYDHATANSAALETRHTEVFLLVYPPGRNDATRHDLHWSLAWKVDDRRWKYVQLSVQDHDGGSPADSDTPTQHCPYCGAQTRSVPGRSDGERPRPFSLGRMGVRARNRVEEIARGVPVCAPGGLWTCQHWVLGVLRRVADEGLVAQRVLEDTVGAAYNAWNDFLL